MKQPCLFLCFLILFFYNPSRATASEWDTMHISSPVKALQAGPYLGLLHDKEGRMTISQVAAISQEFQRNHTNIPVFASEQTYVWVKLVLVNSTGRHLWLGVDNPVTDTILYYEQAGGEFIQKMSGDKVDFSQRDIHSSRILFHISAINEPVTIYLRLNIRLPRQFPVYITAADASMQAGSTSFFIDGIFYGLIAVIVLYNLFLWLSLRDRFYLYYIGYILCSGLLLLHFDGITYAYLWPGYPSVNDHPAILASMPMFFALFFVRSFLNLSQTGGRYQYGLWLFGALLLVSCILSLAGKKFMALEITQSAAFFGVVYFLLPGIRLMRKGYVPARYYLAAWSFLIVSVLVFLAKDMAWIPYNGFTANALKLGIGAEAVLMAFALADRINFMKKVQVKLEGEKARERAKRIKAEDELKTATELLDEFTEHLKEKNKLLENFTADMQALEQKLKGSDHLPDTAYLQKLRESVILTKDDWQQFRQLFNKVHTGYIYRLKEKYAGLTESEIRLLTLMKLHLSQDEIAGMLGVSTDAVRKAKQRLRKKIGLQSEEDIELLVSAI